MFDDLKREVAETVEAINTAVTKHGELKTAHAETKTALDNAQARVAELQAQVAAGATVDQAAIDQMAADLDAAQKTLATATAAGEGATEALESAPTPTVPEEPPADPNAPTG